MADAPQFPDTYAEQDPDKVLQWRRQWTAEDVYGQRLEVVPGKPDTAHLPPYLASLMVCEDVRATGVSAADFYKTAYRSLRPYGGTLCLLSAEQGRALARAGTAGLEKASLRSADEFTLLELAQIVIEVTGSKSEIIFEALPTDDPQVRQPDITLAKEILAWEPTVDLREGLRRTISQAGRETLVGASL